jgi:hypothetical protein
MSNYSNAWDETAPNINDAAALGAGEITKFKSEIRQRLATEHTDISNSAGDALLKHLSGRCSVFFYGTTAGIAALTSPPQYAVAWDTTLQCLKIYNGSAWTIHYQTPWVIDFNLILTPSDNTNWNTVTGGTVSPTGRHSTGDVNASLSWPVTLVAGTYTFSLAHNKGSDRGIYSVQLDSVEAGTIDGYNASALFAVGSVAGIVVAATAKIIISLVMATKHASSSSYMGNVLAARLLRTA